MMGVLHILPQAPVMEPPVVVLANAFLAALNGLRLLAPVTLLRGLATAFGASPANAVDALLEASTKAFLVPLVRSGLIEGGMVLRLVMCNSVSQGNARNEKRKEGFLSQQGCKELAASAGTALRASVLQLWKHPRSPVAVDCSCPPVRDRGLPQIERPTVSPPPHHALGEIAR